MLIRPRRNRRSAAIRALVRETRLSPENLVLPLFVLEEGKKPEAITSLPGTMRLPLEDAVARAKEAHALGVPAVALFPVVPARRKDRTASAALEPDGIVPRTIRALKDSVPGLAVITDVALDPYNSDGHDGLWREGRVVNDETLPLLAKMALVHARAGADVVAPSDMMDGRVRAIREALDAEGFSETAICSYCMKYASSFYGPFRDALDSAPGAGDKKGYQADPANTRETLREIRLDEQEGADWLMVKPGLPYLDIVRLASEATALPVAVYHTSGELVMLLAAAERGWLDYEKCLLEALTGFRRAGARIIFTYAAIDAARLLREG